MSNSYPSQAQSSAPQPDPTAVLQWDEVIKRFGNKDAVDRMSLSIPRGSFYGLVGPNGAGKTTAILIATGLLEPTYGNCWIAGNSMWFNTTPEEVNRGKMSYGLLADGIATFDRLTAPEYLEYLGYLRGMDAATIAQRSEEILNALDLQDTGKKIIADFSAGMTKKILLAGALLHSPELLILDEPFEAVDPVSADVIKQILRQYVAAGGTVILSSHVMELVEGLCTHVAIMNNGTVHVSGTLDEVRDGKSLNERFVEHVGARHLTQGSLGWLRGSQHPNNGEDTDL
ncbi:MAG TPA: ABC transporter ATP-binding protein [Candidatus Corynebacterium gallistercoris]|uniref:ABC transporter ATP-binding protein n=1 Tax=Candidatus Corynebacterium gallistercoris TaxID=2838530 RepID=A0A9D1RY18_9CORY|nr:ABC transporter ATP-binding protein [Candidatus Corynebacterium gallistercoris]